MRLVIYIVEEDGIPSTLGGGMISRNVDRNKGKQPKSPVWSRKLKHKRNVRVPSEIEAMLQVLPDIFFVIDLDGSIVRWNRAGELITGFKAAEILEKPALDFFPQSDHHRILEAINE